MNRFIRSAFFPLIVIVLLVWLATTELIPKGKSTQAVTYSQLRADIVAAPASYSNVDFNPDKRSITAEIVKTGKKITAWVAIQREGTTV